MAILPEDKVQIMLAGVSRPFYRVRPLRSNVMSSATTCFRI